MADSPASVALMPDSRSDSAAFVALSAACDADSTAEAADADAAAALAAAASSYSFAFVTSAVYSSVDTTVGSGTVAAAIRSVYL